MREDKQDELIVSLIHRNINLKQRVDVLEEMIAAISKEADYQTRLRWVYYRERQRMQEQWKALHDRQSVIINSIAYEEVLFQ